MNLEPSEEIAEVDYTCVSCKADIIEKDNPSFFPLKGLYHFHPLCDECIKKAQQAAIDYLESDKS